MSGNYYRRNFNVQVWIGLLNWLIGLIALSFIAIYCWIAISRINYPFELEWIEGAAVDSVRRVLSGRPLFVAPTLEFAPFMYTPLYFWVSAAVAKVIGIGFMPLRLVSFLSSLGCFALIYAIVKQETKNNWAGIFASGLYAATFKIGGAWFDIARIDSFFMVCVLAALFFLRRPGKLWLWSIIGGIMFCLAYYSKQAAILIFLPIMLGSMLHDRPRATWYIPIALIIIVVVHWIANSISHGWYQYYLYELPQRHPFLTNVYLDYWILDLFRPLPIAVALVICYLFVILKQKRQVDYFWAYVTLGMLGSSYLFRLHAGGYNNVLFPVYSGIAILSGLAMHEAENRIKTRSGNEMYYLVPIVFLLLAGQFILLVYNPIQQIPTKQDREAGETFLKSIKVIPGEVFAPWTGYLPSLVGKKTKIHIGTIGDIVTKGPQSKVRDQLIRDLSDAIRKKEFGAIITINGDVENGKSWFFSILGDDLEKYYQISRRFEWGNNYWPVTGARRRPEYIWIPRESTP